MRSVVERTVPREAPEVDRKGRSPGASVEALAEAGLLDLLGAPEAGGAGLVGANHLLFGREGAPPPGGTRVLAQTEPYGHCTVTVVDTAPATSSRSSRTSTRGGTMPSP